MEIATKQKGLEGYIHHSLVGIIGTGMPEPPKSDSSLIYQNIQSTSFPKYNQQVGSQNHTVLTYTMYYINSP